MKRFRTMWQSLWVDADRRVRLGRVLGMVFVTAGFVVVALGWNGAAGRNLIQTQFPYLLSGGFMGVGLVVLGGFLWMLSTIRAERQVLTDRVDEMISLLSRNLARAGASTNGAVLEASDQQVVATKTSYHLAGCRVLEGKDGLVPLTLAQAVAEGLTACRVCGPPEPPKQEEAAEATDDEATTAAEAS